MSEAPNPRKAENSDTFTIEYVYTTLAEHYHFDVIEFKSFEAARDWIAERHPDYTSYGICVLAGSSVEVELTEGETGA